MFHKMHISMEYQIEYIIFSNFIYKSIHFNKWNLFIYVLVVNFYNINYDTKIHTVRKILLNVFILIV